jgi:hypothetical protein
MRKQIVKLSQQHNKLADAATHLDELRSIATEKIISVLPPVLDSTQSLDVPEDGVSNVMDRIRRLAERSQTAVAQTRSHAPIDDATLVDTDQEEEQEENTDESDSDVLDGEPEHVSRKSTLTIENGSLSRAIEPVVDHVPPGRANTPRPVVMSVAPSPVAKQPTRTVFQRVATLSPEPRTGNQSALALPQSTVALSPWPSHVATQQSDLPLTTQSRHSVTAHKPTPTATHRSLGQSPGRIATRDKVTHERFPPDRVSDPATKSRYSATKYVDASLGQRPDRRAIREVSFAQTHPAPTHEADSRLPSSKTDQNKRHSSKKHRETDSASVVDLPVLEPSIQFFVRKA